MRVACATIALAASVAGASAHEYDDFEIANFSIEGQYLVIRLQDTVKGTSIVCAGYDDDGDLVASGTWITDALATEALVQGENMSAVVSVRCVPN